MIISDAAKVNYWLAIEAYRQVPEGKTEDSNITKPSLQSIQMQDIAFYIKTVHKCLKKFIHLSQNLIINGLFYIAE